MARNEIQVDGLNEFRRRLRATDQDAVKELRTVVKRAAEIVAVDARLHVPRRTGKLAASIRAGTSGSTGLVRSRLPYARVHEWGGTIRPRGVPITIQRSEYIARALDRKRDEVYRDLEDGIADIARRNGWD